MRCTTRYRHGDAVAVRQRAQLLESLEAFDGRRGEPGEAAQEPGAVSIDAEVAVDREAAGNRADAARECIARVGYRRPAEIERIAVVVQHDLDGVRIGELPGVAHRVRGGRHVRFPAAQQAGDLPDQQGIDQRLVALHVDDDMTGSVAPARSDFGQPVRPRRVTCVRHHRLVAVPRGGGRNALVVRGDQHFVRAAPAGLVSHSHHHWPSGQIDERLAGQAGGGVAGGNDYRELQRRDT
jgi:hypothetical protein